MRRLAALLSWHTNFHAPFKQLRVRRSRTARDKVSCRRALFLEQLEDRRVLSTFTVLNTDDSGAGSLRQAIVDANNNAGDDVINFSVTGTINLTGALPDLNSNMQIQGPGADSLTVRRDTGGDYRIFTVVEGSTVEFDDLTISNGVGGGIYNHGGTLTVRDSTFAGNTGTTFTSVSFLGTFDQLVGSGIYNSFGGKATVSGSSFTGNTGSGIFNHYVSGSFTTVNVSDSTFSGNQAEMGGGIYSYGGGIVQVDNSTFFHNSASGQTFSSGGGINCFIAGTLTVSNSTFSDNQANYDLAGVNFSGSGGGGGACDISQHRVARRTLYRIRRLQNDAARLDFGHQFGLRFDAGRPAQSDTMLMVFSASDSASVLTATVLRAAACKFPSLCRSTPRRHSSASR